MAAPSNSSSIDRLDECHKNTFRRAIENILTTDLAFETYAQIIDGLPICRVAWDLNPNSRVLTDQHPIDDRVGLCSAAVEKAKEFRGGFDSSSLRFKPETLAAYQAAPESSRAFKLRIIELTVEALHQIAVFLFQNCEHHHDPETTAGLDVEAVTFWEPPPGLFERVPPKPTLFTHVGLIHHKLYPSGVADVVGYWAEDRILGGVALFDRTRSWKGHQEPNVWYQSSRADVTYRICQLLDKQHDSLLEFLLPEQDGPHMVECPLSILTTRDNRTRISPSDAIATHKVYRDPWERKPPKPLTRLQRLGKRRRCVVDPIDYPEEDPDAEAQQVNEIYDDFKRRGEI